MAYVPTVWIDDQAPAIDAVNLNHIENGIESAHNDIADIIDGDIIVGKAQVAITAESLTTTIAISPVGSIVMWGSSTLPDNYMECNGATLPRTHALFAIIGTTFGIGDGSTTFNLPDLRAQFIRGWDHGKGTDTGRKLGSAQEDAFQGHTFVDGRNDRFLGGVDDRGSGSGNVIGSRSSTFTDNSIQIAADDEHGEPRVAKETRPINIALMYIIKVS